VAKAGSSLRGWMQSTGQTSTQAVSLVPTQGSQMIYAIPLILLVFAPASQPDPALACDAVLAAAFAPRRPSLGTFEVCTTALPPEEFRIGGFTYGGVEHLEAPDAFGAAPVDRGRLARLYGGRRAVVLRGWREEPDAFESMTLISPYPDPSLTRLEAGTLVIRYRFPAPIAISP